MLKGNAELNFGNGDIHIVSSCDMDGEIGYVVFENSKTPMPIGINYEGFNKEFVPKEYPIIMTFTKTESIDALIDELLYVKENMIRLHK